MAFSTHGVSLCVLWFFCLRTVYFSGTSSVESFENSVAVGTTKSGTPELHSLLEVFQITQLA